MKKLVSPKTAPLYILCVMTALLGACNPLPNNATPTPEATASASPAPEMNTYTLYVNSQEVDCVGVAPQKCLQIRRSESESWSFFYDKIQGFTFEPGFIYTLKVSEEEIENPPADASSKRIKLEEVISKTATQATAAS
jgi:hypothetical protein